MPATEDMNQNKWDKQHWIIRLMAGAKQSKSDEMVISGRRGPLLPRRAIL